MEEDTDDRKTQAALEACEETVEQLREENTQLRQSSRAFGDLAERLNARRLADRTGRRPVRSKP